MKERGAIGPDVTLYGLRHTLAVVLREGGADDRQIADALAHTGTNLAPLYTRGSDLQRAMQPVMAILEREFDARD